MGHSSYLMVHLLSLLFQIAFCGEETNKFIQRKDTFGSSYFIGDDIGLAKSHWNEVKINHGTNHRIRQHLSLPHSRKIITLDIIMHEKVYIVLQENPNVDFIHFELESSSPYHDQVHGLEMDHSTLETSRDIFITLQVKYWSTAKKGPGFGFWAGVASLIAGMFLLHYWQKRKSKASEEQVFNLKIQTSSAKENCLSYYREDTDTSKNSTCEVYGQDTSAGNGNIPREQQDMDMCEEKVLDEEDAREHDNDGRQDKQFQAVHNICHIATVPRAGRLKPASMVLLIVCGLLIVIGMVYAFESIANTHILTVSLPSSAIVRKVRSYSEDPDLSDISLNSSSLSLITRLHIMDFHKDCKNNVTACSTFALCDGKKGSLKCRCKRGYYVDEQKCKACSSSCPDGHYMETPCTSHNDVVCKPCSSCEGSLYEVAACSTTQDRVCIGVNFPLSYINWKSGLVEGDSFINVSSSGNVFMEKLRNIKDLEGVLYITNNQQAMSFMWTRESGLEIKISLSEVYLVPEYVDLDHLDDSQFLLRDSYSTAEEVKNMFNAIRKDYCRHPLPDQYQLVMEVMPNRTLAAQLITCDSQNSSVSSCPSHYKDGEKYLLTSLNHSCPKLKTDVSGLTQASNSILCPGGSPLLTRVLQIPDIKMAELTFPTSQCQINLRECKQCLRDMTCDNQTNSAEADCCNVHCLSKPICQYAFSPECPPTPVECANGDVYRFTLIPKYNSLLERYMCHVKYKKPKQLYKVDYIVNIPKINYSVAERTHIIPAANMSYHIQGSHMVDFINVSHQTGMSLEKEGIIIGKYDRKTPDLFKFHRLKSHGEFRSKKFRVRPVNEYLYSTNIQFAQPFAYSSSSWDKDQCDKDLLKIFPAQKMYREEGIVMEPTILEQDGVFLYQSMRSDRAPSVKFQIDGKKSVLSTFQSEFHTSHIDRSTLTAKLSWSEKNGCWNITIEGSLTTCPGYISAEIFDKFMTSSLGLYDTIIRCSESFTMSFSLFRPRNIARPDVFVAVLNDSITSHQLILTSLEEPRLLPIQEIPYVPLKFTEDSPWRPIFVIFIIMGVVFCIVLPIFIYITIVKKRKKSGKIAKSASSLLKSKNGEKVESEEYKSHAKPSPRGILCIFAISYIIYSIMFSFTVMFGLLYVTQAPFLDKLSDVSNTSAKIQDAVKQNLDQMESYRFKEEKQTLELMKQRTLACEYHLNTELQQTLKQLGSHIDYLIEKLYKEEMAYSALDGFLKSKSEKYKERMSDFIAECNHTVQTHLHGVTQLYRSYLQKVSDSGWLAFPHSLFASQLGRNPSDRIENIAEFMAWMEMDKVDQVLFVKDDVLHRLVFTMPELMSFLENDEDRRDEMSKNSLRNMNTNQNSYINPRHSFRYTVSQKHSFLNSNQSDSLLQPSNTTEDLMQSKEYVMSDIRMVLYPVFICVFITLDVLLLMYRFTWLQQTIQLAKNGFENKTPLDCVAVKTLFLTTGQQISKASERFDHPYAYYMENKENLWTDHSELYQHYCQVSPRSKEDILREIWNHRKKQKEKKHESIGVHLTQCVKRTIKSIYNCIISRSFWRFVLAGTFILFLCLICQIADDLITMETVTFLMDTESILLQLQKQNFMVNRLLSQHDRGVNNYLNHYRSAIETEIGITNSVLREASDKQTSLLLSVMSELCVMGQTTLCDYTKPAPVTAFLSTCNFLPVHTQLFEGYHEEVVKDYLLKELFPLVSTLRSVVFTTCYVLLTYACIMVVCQLIARIIFIYLIRTKKLPTSIIFQTSNTIDCWLDEHPNDIKDIYRSQSWIESCESGVYVGDNEDSVRESTM